MNLFKKIVIIISILVMIFTIIWGINIVPKQMDFDNYCKTICQSKSLDYEVEMASYPWNNVNGKCYCKKIIPATEIINYDSNGSEVSQDV